MLTRINIAIWLVRDTLVIGVVFLESIASPFYLASSPQTPLTVTILIANALHHGPLKAHQEDSHSLS